MASNGVECSDEELGEVTDAELVELDRLARATSNEQFARSDRELAFEWVSWIPHSVNSWVSWSGSGSRPTIESVLAEASGRPATDGEIEFARSWALNQRIEREKGNRVRLMLETARRATGLTHQEIAAVTGLKPELIALIEQGRAWSARPDLFEQTCSIDGEKEARHLSRTPWRPLADLRLCRTIRPVTIDPAWIVSNEGVALRMARSIRKARDFGRLPALGEVLAQAGCADESILNHCRNPGLHAAGCWVVDALVRAGRPA